MGTLADKWNSDDDDGEYSVIGDKGEIGFIDYEQDKSVYDYNPYDHPVFISVPFPMVDGKPQSTLVGETTFESITIKNNTSEEVDLWGVKIYASNPENSFTLSLMKPPSISGINAVQDFLESYSLEDRVLQPGDTLTVWLSCKPKNVGLYTTAVHFDMSHSRVERVVFLLVDDTISRSLVSKKPYSRSTKKKYFDVDNYVVGSRPARATYRASRKKLPLYEIPNDIRLLLENKQIPDSIRGGLTRNSYACFFKTLVIMEELQLEEDMSSFSMECVTMSRKGSQYLTLVVPGLAERRPSLVHGDAIFAKLASSEGNLPPYQGFIHHVKADEIYLKFAKEFHKSHRDENLYNVQFTYCRFNMRRLYQAIDAAGELETMLLFPSEISEKRIIDTTPAIPISCNLNEEQMFAVEMILGCKGIPPYLIHGPPGTGKTMTIVEATLQLYRGHENSRVLVCAPSNSAADHLLKSLLNEKTVVVQDHEIFRLNAASRPYEDVDPKHIRFCFFDEQVFKCPPLNALMRYNIIVSTYMSSSLLSAEGLEMGHFSHIFLDEAGQASEPEIMVPLANFCCKDTVVVLAGDPMQLGPVVFSKEAESHGLGKSYMERLFECEPYYCGDENYVTKLVRNYRSHPDILYLPSTLFYGGELIASKDDSTFINPCADLVPNGNFPILFIGIQGYDEREGGNPSWFNRIEISKVVEIIRRLLACEILSENDIGIIAPYRQQVLKLKTAFERLDMADIKVGSVEQFQGQERKIIIVSTVRSTIKHNEFDRIHCLGFLSNPKRFNVAVTRAISLLIIIGNPHIIAKDPYWNKLLWYCVDNNSYHGCILPEREEFETTDPIQGDHVAGQEGNSWVKEGKDLIQDENVWGQEENGWGHKGNDWGQDGNEGGREGNDWNQVQNGWGHKGNDWGQDGNEGGREGNDWNQVQNGWGQESSQWAQEENDSGQEVNQWVQEDNEWGHGGNGWMEDYKKKGTPLPVHKGNNQGSGSWQINTSLAVQEGNDWPQDSWERKSNLPVKDEDEWSDGWK